MGRGREPKGFEGEGSLLSPFTRVGFANLSFMPTDPRAPITSTRHKSDLHPTPSARLWRGAGFML